MSLSQLRHQHYDLCNKPRHYIIHYAIDRGVRKIWYQPVAISAEDAFQDALAHFQSLLDIINHGKHKQNIVTREQVTLYVDGQAMGIKPVEAQNARKERYAVERSTRRGWHEECSFRSETKARDYILNDPSAEGLRIVDRKKKGKKRS